MTKPNGYKEWRKLYWITLHHLGTVCETTDMMKKYPRDIHRLQSRIRRIKNQMDAEWEAMTTSCADAVLEMIYEE